MKTLWAAMILLLLVAICGGREYLATWDPNTEEDLAGYYVYIVHQTSIDSLKEYQRIATVDSNAFVFTYDGNFCMAIAAFDYSGNHSDFSETVCMIYGDFNNDNQVTILDNIAFNVQWKMFQLGGHYEPKFDLWPPDNPDSLINIYDKLQFHKYWRP